MAEPLKEMFNAAYYTRLAAAFRKTYGAFPSDQFQEDALRGIDPRSLNERMRHTAITLRQHLPQDYKKAIEIMQSVISDTPRGYTNLLFPDFVGLYGRTDFETSMQALKHFTHFGSSEFAIREFLRDDFPRTIAVMKTWATDPSDHVRRLASEGSRPRLPWSFKLDAVLQDPTLTQPILQTLRADDALYVRKSVANHLNDLSKDHPDYMLDLVQHWDQSNPHTAWIIKHAARTLIKKGNPKSLSLFAFEADTQVQLQDLQLSSHHLNLGDTLTFSFTLHSQKPTPQKLVIDYRVHYPKPSGQTTTKVFKLKELILPPSATATITKSQTFKDFSTRTHAPGTHRIDILINGHTAATSQFNLILPPK